jgi:hypothetical protein
MTAARWYWLGLGVVACTLAFAEPPPPVSPPDAAESQPAPAPAPDPGASDEFIEFLGGDDVGDAAWWEFLKKSAPRKDQPPVPPPQDATQ